jgi:Tfp pilus assembly protein PilV
MRNNWPHCRRGFVLAEALIALLILGVVFLALEGSLSIVLRSLADSERDKIAATLAETQRERAFAAPCVAASGADSINAVTVSWIATAAAGRVRVTQTSRYPRHIGSRVENYDAISACGTP